MFRWCLIASLAAAASALAAGGVQLGLLVFAPDKARVSLVVRQPDGGAVWSHRSTVAHPIDEYPAAQIAGPKLPIGSYQLSSKARLPDGGVCAASAAFELTREHVSALGVVRAVEDLCNVTFNARTESDGVLRAGDFPPYEPPYVQGKPP